jgi:hypothetical protein
MNNDNIKIKWIKEVRSHAPMGILFAAFLFVVWLNNQKIPVHNYEWQHVSDSPLLTKDESTSHEKKIAGHFSADTLPRMMQTGLFKKYRRSASGTCISVNGNLWKKRSRYFKQNLLSEVIVYNKVNGFELATVIVDSVSGKLYAQISSSAKIDIYI